MKSLHAELIGWVVWAVCRIGLAGRRHFWSGAMRFAALRIDQLRMSLGHELGYESFYHHLLILDI